LASITPLLVWYGLSSVKSDMDVQLKAVKADLAEQERIKQVA
jgi:hypothetical protein